MINHPLRIFRIVSFFVMIAGAASQAKISHEAKAFLDQLAAKRAALSAVTINPYSSLSIGSIGPSFTYVSGKGFKISNTSTGVPYYSANRMEKSNFYFLKTGLFSVNATGELLTEPLAETIQQLPYYFYCAPFLTTGVLNGQGDTRLERDADEIRLITTTDAVSDRIKQLKVPPHLIPVGMETVLAFSAKDFRLLGLKTSLLQAGRKTRLGEWRVTSWQTINGVFLPRKVRSVTDLSQMYDAYSYVPAPEWTVVSPAAAKKIVWLDTHRLMSVTPLRTVDGILPSALPSPAIAADYARALTAWREGDLQTAQKGFEALTAASPGLIAPRARLLELQMLSDLPGATDAWIAWLKQDISRGNELSCPVFLSKYVAFSPEKRSALGQFLMDYLDNPAASSIFTTLMASSMSYSGSMLPKDDLVKKIETLLDGSPSPVTIQTCLQIIGGLTSQKDRLPQAELLMDKCRRTGVVTLTKYPNLFQAFSMIQVEFRKKKGTTEAWKQRMLALPSLTTEQQYELFTQYCRDREFIPAFKRAIQLMRKKDFPANTLVLSPLRSISYSPITLNANDKLELVTLLKEDLPFELVPTALQACVRNHFDEGVDTILNQLKNTNYQDLDGWQLLRIALTMTRFNGGASKAEENQAADLFKLAMDRLPDDQTRALVALSHQQQPMIGETLKGYYTDIDPWSLDWNFFSLWLRTELKKAANSPEALDTLVTTLGGDAEATRKWVTDNLPDTTSPGQQMVPSAYKPQSIDWSDPAAPGPKYSLFYSGAKDDDKTARLWRLFKLSPLYRSEAAQNLLRINLSVEKKSHIITAELDRGAPFQRGYWRSYVDPLVKAGKSGQLERLYQQILQYNPRDTSTLSGLYALWVKENKPAKAAKLTLDYYPETPVESVSSFGDMLRALSDENREKLSNSLRRDAETPTKDNQIRLAFALSQWGQYEKAAAIFEPLTVGEKSRAHVVFTMWLQAAYKAPDKITEQARIYRLYLERCPGSLSFSSALLAIRRAEGEDAAISLAQKLAESPDITIEQGVDIVSFLRGRRKYEEALAIAKKVKDAPSQRGGNNAAYSQSRLQNEEIECLKALGKNEDVQAKSIEAILAWDPRKGDYQLREILNRLARSAQAITAPRTGTTPSSPDPALCDKIEKAINEKMTDTNTRQLALIQLYTVFNQLPKAGKIARDRVAKHPDFNNYRLLIDLEKRSKSPDQVNRVITLYEKAMKLQPDLNTYEAYNLVSWVFQNGENEDAIRPVWEKYENLKPVRQNRANLARTAQRRGFTALASELIKESDDDDANIMIQRLQVLMKKGEYEKALATIDKTRTFIENQETSQAKYLNMNLDNAIERSTRELRGKPAELEKLVNLIGDPGDDLNRLRLVVTIKKTQFEISRSANDSVRGKIGNEVLDLLEKMVDIGGAKLSSNDYYQLQYIAAETKDAERIIRAQNILLKQNEQRAKDYGRMLQVLYEINPEKAVKQGLVWAKTTRTPGPFLQLLARQKQSPEKGLEIIGELTKDDPDGSLAKQCLPFKATWLIATGKLAEGVALIERLDINDVRRMNNSVTSQAILDAVHQKAISLDKGITLITKVAGGSSKSAFYWNGLARKNCGKANPLVAVTLAEKAVAMENRGDFLETLALAQALSQSKDWRKNFQATIAKMNGGNGNRIARVGYQLCQRGERMDPVPPAIVDAVLDLCQEPKLIASYGYYVNRFLKKAMKQDQLLGAYLDILRKARAIPPDMSAAAAKKKRGEAEELTESIFTRLRGDLAIMTQLKTFSADHPNHAEALELMSIEHQRRGRQEQALEAFAQVVQLRGAAAGAGDYYRLALIHAQSGDVAATRKNFRKAVEIDPELAKKYPAIMNAMAFRFQWKEAMAFGTEWATVSGEIVGFLDRLNQGRPRQPERWLETAADLIAQSKDQDKTKKICAPFQALWLLETGQTKAGLALLDTINKETVTSLRETQRVARLIRDAAWRSGKITPADAITRIEKLLDDRRLKDSYFWENMASISTVNDEERRAASVIAGPLLEKARALKPADDDIAMRLLICQIDSRSPGWIQKTKVACDQWLKKSPNRVMSIVNTICRSYKQGDDVPKEVLELVVTLTEDKEIYRQCSYEAQKFFEQAGDGEMSVRLAQKALETCEKQSLRFQYVERLVQALRNSEDPERIIPLLTTEIPKFTDWGYVPILYSRLGYMVRKSGRNDDRAAIADKIVAATSADNVIVRGKAMIFMGERQAGATLIYDAFMAAPDGKKFPSTYRALEEAGMYENILTMTEKIIAVSPEDQKANYQEAYNATLINVGRTDEALANIKKNVKDYVKSGRYYTLGYALAKKHQTVVLNKLYEMFLAEAEKGIGRKSTVHEQFLRFFRRAGDANGVNKAGRRLLAMDGQNDNQRQSWLRTWGYYAKSTHSTPRFCQELAALIKERPNDTILEPALKAAMGTLSATDLANALGSVDDMLLDTTPAALRTNARLLTKAKRPEDALKLLAVLQKKYPDQLTPADRRTLIEAYALTQDWDAAMAVVNTWRKQAPDDLTPLFSAAQIMMRADRQPEVRALLAKARELAGDTPAKLIPYHAEYIRYLQRAKQPAAALDYWMTTLKQFPSVTRKALPTIQKLLDDQAAYDPYLREAARTFASQPESAKYLKVLKKISGDTKTPDAWFAVNFGILESRPDMEAFSNLLTTMRRDWDSDYQVSTATEFIRVYPEHAERMLTLIVQTYANETDRGTLKDGVKKQLQKGNPSPALLGIEARVKADEGHPAESAKLFGEAARKTTGVLKAALTICQARALAADHPDQARKILAAVAKAADAGPLAKTAQHLAESPIKELAFNNQEN